MMKKSAVLFLLIFTILSSNFIVSCGSGQNTAAGSLETQASPGSQPAPDSQKASEKQAAAGPSKAPDNQAASKTTDTNAVIPDTNESAVSNWGVADAPTSTSGSNIASDPGSASPGSNTASDPSSASPGSNTTGDDTQTTPYSQVIVDREELFWAIKEVRDDGALGYSWKVYIENRTDKNLMFSFEKVAVNDVMCDPYWAEVVAAGKKGNAEITWMRDALDERGIGEVAKVDFTLNVYNDDNYMEAPLMHDPFTVYPLGDSQAAAAGGAKSDGQAPAPSDAQTPPASASPQQPGSGQTAGGSFPARQSAETDQVLINNEDCLIVVTGFDPDNSWGYAVRLYLCNRTDRDLIFSVENSSVNGIMCEPYWAEIVTAGKSAISTILWDKAALNENKIEEVKEISLPMRVCSDNNVEDLYVDETFTLKP